MGPRGPPGPAGSSVSTFFPLLSPQNDSHVAVCDFFLHHRVFSDLNLQNSSNICNSGHTNSELRQSMEGLCSSLVTFARELQRHVV